MCVYDLISKRMKNQLNYTTWLEHLQRSSSIPLFRHIREQDSEDRDPSISNAAPQFRRGSSNFWRARFSSLCLARESHSPNNILLVSRSSCISSCFAQLNGVEIEACLLVSNGEALDETLAQFKACLLTMSNMDFYSNLISNGSYDNPESYMSQDPLLSQIPNSQDEDQFPIQSEVRPSASNPKKRTRTGNFSEAEDLLLISAWQNIHHDSITGTNQSSDKYWERIHTNFHQNKKFPSDRSANSLMHRWSAIQLAVGKFCGELSLIEGRNQSGITEQDKVCQAMQMYKKCSKEKKDFVFLHCWNALRYAPKFITYLASKKEKTTENGSSAASSPSTPGLNDGVDPATGLERPMGRKASKELFRQTKKKEKEAEGESLKAFLAEMTEKHSMSTQKKLEKADEIVRMEKNRYELEMQKVTLEKERYELERKKEERKEMENEERILSMDLTKMSPSLVAYYKTRQVTILEARGITGFKL